VAQLQNGAGCCEASEHSSMSCSLDPATEPAAEHNALNANVMPCFMFSSHRHGLVRAFFILPMTSSLLTMPRVLSVSGTLTVITSQRRANSSRSVTSGTPNSFIGSFSWRPKYSSSQSKPWRKSRDRLSVDKPGQLAAGKQLLAHPECCPAGGSSQLSSVAKHSWTTSCEMIPGP